MGVYIRKGIYYFCFTPEGKKAIQRSTGIPVASGSRGRKLAEDAYYKAVLDAKEGKLRNVLSRVSVRELLAWYCKTWAPELKSQGTVNSSVKALIWLLGDDVAAEVTPERLLEVRRIRLTTRGRFRAGVTNATANRDFSVLSAAYSKAMASKDFHLEENPVLKIPILSVEAQKRERLPQESEIDSLYKSLSPLMRQVMIFDLATGLREGELRNAKWTDIDTVSMVLIVRLNKEGKIKKVPLRGDALEILNSLPHLGEYIFCTPDGKQLKKDGLIRSEWKRVTKKLKIKLRFNDLRHGFVSYLTMDSKDAKAAGRMAGHRRPETTERYTHLTDTHIISALSKLRSHLARISKTSTGPRCLPVAAPGHEKMFSHN